MGLLYCDFYIYYNETIISFINIILFISIIKNKEICKITYYKNN
jgi:hypothetical protein